ncbi:hypothetical protein [Nonomuraea typhae]|uniref:hypothetical protein n=1 Tax=Nonomuraea typhae TaxID=2603600 RepID=UPI0012FC1687|nr:hypothetical protein [Nonomuraea typhae]
MAERDAPRTIMARAALARYPAGKLPLLWVDDPAPVTAPVTVGDQINVIIALTLRDGFELVFDPQQPPAPTVHSWRVALDADSMLTVRSPRDPPNQSFVWDLHLPTPLGWREHARKYGAVILLVGSGLHLADTDRLADHAAACARAGLLTSALVAYDETVGAWH